MSVTALMTQSRSSLAARARAAAVELLDEGIEDAVVEGSELWTQEGIIDVPGWSGDVVPAWSECRLRLETAEPLDERVEDAVAGGRGSEARGEIVDVSGVAEGVVSARL